MEETEKLIESMLQFLESSNDEDEEHSFTYEHDYGTTLSTLSSAADSVNFSKSDELSEQELAMTHDSFEPDEIPTDSEKEDDNHDDDDNNKSKDKFKIIGEDDESSESESDEETFFLIDKGQESNYAKDVLEVETTGTLSPDNVSEISSTVSSESFCLRKYPPRYKPRRSRYFKRLTINTIYIREELEKIKDDYPLYAPRKESKKPKVQGRNNTEGLYAGPAFVRSPHVEETSHLEADPFIDEINRCIYGETDNHPPEGSAEYFKAAENYAIYGKSYLCVSSRDTSPSTESTDLELSSGDTLREGSEVDTELSSTSSNDEALEACYNLSPSTEIEDDLNSVDDSPPQIAPILSFLRSPPPYESTGSLNPLLNTTKQFNYPALAANRPPFFQPAIPPPSNNCYNPAQNPNHYFPYPQTFFSPPNITPYFSVAASQTCFSMDHQRQRTAYQQHAYTSYHTQIGPSMPMNQNMHNPQQQYVTPVNTYLQSNQAQYNFNQDRSHGPLTTFQTGENHISTYYEHTSRLQTYQCRHFCPLFIQQPPFPGAQYQHHQMPYFPRPRVIPTLGSPYSMQERATPIRFRPPMQAHQNITFYPYMPPRGPPPPLRFQRFMNPGNINDIRYGNSPRLSFHNKFNNKSSSITYRQRTTRNSETPSATITKASSSQTISTSTNNENSELLETAVALNKNDVKEI